MNMTELQPTKPRRASVTEPAGGRLFFLEVSASRILSMNPDGSKRKVVVTDFRMPDGVAVDLAAGHIYWTNMGASVGTNDGSIERADIDGRNRRDIVPPGGTFTPKQIQLARSGPARPAKRRQEWGRRRMAPMSQTGSE
jgi:hypothetical protein